MTNRRYIKEIIFKSQGTQVSLVLDNGDILDGCEHATISGNPSFFPRAHLTMLVGVGDE